MSSTGNDLVALEAVDFVRSCQPRFYSKFLSSFETDLFDSRLSASLPFGRFVWLAWAVKESVYKFVKRNSENLVFSPLRIMLETVQGPRYVPLTLEAACGVGFQDFPVWTGSARLGDERFYFSGLQTEAFIFCAASDSADFKELHWAVAPAESAEPERQSAAVRSLLRQRLGVLFPGRSFRIGKDFVGCPILSETDSGRNIPVSFAHHGLFTAFTFPNYP